ncbi:MAG: N-acetylmuramoyl-L-alanine amidase, partial [Chloroflexi bacterium]|nr:N-acetylmuramoyl-L-alanine amidase [Chloroflexota bacterium]
MTYRPEYASVSKFIVHHTVTSDGGADPAATIRAIYYYHAVTLGWGDIGYNYLIGHGGNAYEGRAGGPNAIGIHAGRFNRGSDGIALLGTFTEQAPSTPMLGGLASIIGWR